MVVGGLGASIKLDAMGPPLEETGLLPIDKPASEGSGESRLIVETVSAPPPPPRKEKLESGCNRTPSDPSAANSDAMGGTSDKTPEDVSVLALAVPLASGTSAGVASVVAGVLFRKLNPLPAGAASVAGGAGSGAGAAPGFKNEKPDEVAAAGSASAAGAGAAAFKKENPLPGGAGALSVAPS